LATDQGSGERDFLSLLLNYQAINGSTVITVEPLKSKQADESRTK